MSRVTVPGVDGAEVALHVQLLGDAGPPAVMLHGLLIGSLAAWYFTAAPALAQAHRVLLYDLRGHGHSDRTAGGYDLATLAGDLGALIDQQFPGEAVALIGHSYGALVALRFALDQPSRVARLALVEAPLPPSSLGDLDQLLARTPAEMVAALPEPLRAVLGAQGRRARKLLDRLRFLTAESTLLGDLRSAPDLADAELASVACPTLAVYGADSRCRPAGERLARSIPGARLVVLPGGHYLHLDSPAALSAELAAFCAPERADG